MLVLTRKPSEAIRIGEQITVTVLNVHGNRVRLGIDAPREVMVVRKELPRAVTLARDASTRTASVSPDTTEEHLRHARVFDINP